MAQPGQPLPLQGVKMIELGSLIVGPCTGTLLAQFDAEVIKIETPVNGDPLRKQRKLHDGTSLWWYSQGRNKKSVTLNLRSGRTQQIVHDLVKDTDVMIENFRPGLMKSQGLGWEQLSAINPRLVIMRISGYGQSGPYRERLGFAAIAESMDGLRYLSDYADRPPVRVGVSLGGSLAFLCDVIGALLAIHHVEANRSTGQFIDVTLYEAVFGITESLIPGYAIFEHVRERTGSSLPGISPSNTYLCADGNYVIIADNGDGIFKRLMQAIGLPEPTEDTRFADNVGCIQHNDPLDGVIGGWTVRHLISAVLQVLEQTDMPGGRIYTVTNIAHNPQYTARGMTEYHALPDDQPIGLPGIVPKLSATPGSMRWIGPELGEHTDEVLHALGLDAAMLDDLRTEGIIRQRNHA